MGHSLTSRFHALFLIVKHTSCSIHSYITRLVSDIRRVHLGYHSLCSILCTMMDIITTARHRSITTIQSCLKMDCRIAAQSPRQIHWLVLTTHTNKCFSHRAKCLSKTMHSSSEPIASSVVEYQSSHSRLQI